MKKNKINIVTLGCSKNLVDSEKLLYQLRENGYDVVFDSNDTDAATVVVNTCGFIGDAKEESIDTILGFVRAKEEGFVDRLFVMGCLSQRYRDELADEIPEVDEYFGVNNIWDVVEKIGGKYRKSHGRHLTTPSHYAYLKISEGCDRGCGYCAIPLIRGRHVSVPMEELIEEARELAAKGVRELIVIAQDTTYYGLDLYGERRLGELLRRLCRVEGIEWIRLLYGYPADFPENVIEAIRDEPKMCKYLDIPFQHISDGQLSSMRREVTKAETYALIERLRNEIPGIAIRTTLLVGYPGETEEDYAELLDFVRKVKFDRLGVFPYSEEEGTWSARNLCDDVPQEVKQARAEGIMALQNGISLAGNEKKDGTLQRVIIDRREGPYYTGRTQYDAPEVDQEVMVSSEKRLETGRFYDVRVTRADDYDLYADFL